MRPIPRKLNGRSMKTLAVAFLLAIACLVHGHAQSNDQIQRTWKGPDISALWGLLKEEQPGARPRSNPLKFTPAADSGVARALADAFGSSAEQRAALVDAFAQIKQGYEAEVAKEGKSNNVAAAMTFFIAANVVAYHQTEMPSDADTDKLFASLQAALAKIPAFAAMSNAEKQQVHDWLVYMGGFSLTTTWTPNKAATRKGWRRSRILLIIRCDLFSVLKVRR